jgi:MFS family permease
MTFSCKPNLKEPFSCSGDWLQGPYVYQLYSHYGFAENQIAILFLTGFASSSTFGTMTGPLADKYGRKRLALVFAVVYGICCAIKMSNSFWVLILGRVMGEYSTKTHI